MARATGRRLGAGLCFMIGAFTIVGIPVFWPLAYFLYRDARNAEEEREREIEALEKDAGDTDEPI